MSGYKGQEFHMEDITNHGANIRFDENTRDHSFSDEADSGGTYTMNHRTTSLHRNRAYEHKKRTQINWAQTAATLRRWPCADTTNIIVKGIEKDYTLNADTTQAEQLRKEALRDLPQSLTIKRDVKNKLQHNLQKTKSNRNIGCFKRMQYKMTMFWSNLKTNFVNFLYTIQLWYGTLKCIEGKFGSAVATYFIFYRQIFFINILTLLVIFPLIVLPQIINTDSSIEYSDSFDVSDIFTGNGSFRNSILYYGFYTNDTISVSNLEYMMPYAYFFVMLCTYFVVFVIISVSMAKSYRKSYIETKGGLKNVFANKVICGWDFSIANREAAKLKSSAIYLEIQELMQSLSHKKKRNFMYKLRSFMIQFAMNILFFLILGGIVYGLWILLSTHLLDGGSIVVTAVVINVFISFVPLIFGFLTKYEDYKNPRTTFYINYVRNFILEIAIIGILIAYWVTSDNKDCWETNLGQEIYRLVIFEFIYSLILLALTELARSILYKFWKGIGEPEFNIARYSLQLTYNQTLFWVGLYFAPLLAVVVIIKLFIMWYLITTVVLHFCKPPKRTWKAAQAQTLFLIRSFISLILVMGALGYIIASIKTSKDCGPFKQYDYVYNIIKDGIFKLQNGHLFWKIIIYILKPGVVTFILIAMCMGIYYLRQKEKAQMSIINILRERLRTEAKDRQYILQKLCAGDNRMNADQSIRRRNRDYGETNSDFALLLPSSSNNSFLEFERQ